jgi:DNA-binding NarL/FixJ family response regulator
MNILLVEDNPDDVYFLRTELADVDAGAVRLAHAVRLSGALQRLREERFDVVLLDFFLPDSRGLDTLLRVREHAPDLPVVIMTGLEDEAVARRMLEAGAQGYVVKGQLDGAALLHTLREAIARHRQQKKLPAE